MISHTYLSASLSVKLSSQLHYQHHWRVKRSKFGTVKWIFPGWLPLAAGRVNLVQVGISIIREAQWGNFPPVKGLFQSVFHTEEISRGTAKPSTWQSAAHWATKLQIRKDLIRCKASASIFPFCSWPFLTLNVSTFSFCLCFSFHSYPVDQTSRFIRRTSWFYQNVMVLQRTWGWGRQDEDAKNRPNISQQNVWDDPSISVMNVLLRSINCPDPELHVCTCLLTYVQKLILHFLCLLHLVIYLVTITK